MKKLVLAIVACLAVGASAQTRHYSTGDGIVTALPGGTKVETQVVEVVPVQIPSVTPAPVLFTVPASQARVLHVRNYDLNDTADTLDMLYYPADVRYDVISTRKTTTIKKD